MATLRLLDAHTGPSAAVGDATPINVGIEFTVSTSCDATAVWWWQAETGTSAATRQVGIYPASGTATLLASGSAAPTGTGWQRVQLDTPVTLAPGSYRAVVHHPAGQYSSSAGWWLGSGAGGTGPGMDGITNGILSAPNSTNITGAGGQQSFTEGASLARTEQMFGGASYWVDIEVDDGAGDPEPEQLATPVLTVTGTTAATEAGDDGTITATWPAVDGADSYEAGIVEGADQTEGFVSTGAATSPHTWTGLAPGTYTVAVRALPAE